MDLHFRFWSEEQNEVVRCFYTALMFGHAEGAKAAAAMVDKLEEDKVNLSSILTVSACLHDDGQMCQSICISE